MFDQTTLRRIRLTALGLAITVGTSGLALAQDWRYNDHDRDDWRYNDHDRDDYRYDRDGDRRAFDVARDFGFHDGAYVARQDMHRGKAENPYPRGKYGHADHGYRHEYGDRYSYQNEYARAYRAGYERTYR
ncbi:MAG: hypothetical protein JWO91_2629 [Acidobacteriaceae bacterium]|jgi:hypothetical protein|nr:hypothetical protein [Acidobacteriaceae bacterium]